MTDQPANPAPPRLLLAYSLDRPFDPEIAAKLTTLPGYLGCDLFKPGPGRPQGFGWTHAAMHWVQGPAAAALIRAVLSEDPALAEPGSLTEWVGWSSHTSGAPSPGPDTGWALYAVLAKPKAGREAEYDEWYQSAHIGDMFAAPGFDRCERFVSADDSADGWHFLSLYEIRSNDVAAALTEQLQLMKRPEVTWTEARDRYTNMLMVAAT